jgi:hypothetical protein
MDPFAQKLLCFYHASTFLTGSYFDGEVGLKSGAPRKGLHDSIALLTKISLGLGLEGLSTDFTLEQEPLIFNVRDIQCAFTR